MLAGQPLGHGHVIQVVADGAVVHQLEVGAGGTGEAEARAGQQVAEQVALGLVEGRQLGQVLRMRRHEVGQRPLQRRNATEVHVLVDLAQLGRERRRGDHVAGLPAGDVIGLAEGADHEGAGVELVMGEHADVADAVEHQMLVDLVRHQVDIAITDQLGQLVQFGAGNQRAAGVVRAVEDDHAGARAEGVAHALPVDGEARQCQRHMHAAATGQLHGRLVAVVAGIEDDHLVAGADHRLDGAEDGFGGAGSDGHFGIGADRTAIESGHLGCHLFAQRRQAGHRGVLVMSGGDVPTDRIAQGGWRGEIREALGQVDGADFCGELGHAGEDGGADVGQLAGDHCNPANGDWEVGHSLSPEGFRHHRNAPCRSALCPRNLVPARFASRARSYERQVSPAK
ncbi:hypothetical protein D9M68_549620 [compost metagenome]